MYWHWQNLNERWRNGLMKKGSALRKGRAWWRFGRESSSCIGLEWEFFNGKLNVGTWTDDGENDVVFFLSLVLFSVYLSVAGPWVRSALRRILPKRVSNYDGKTLLTEDREIKLAVHDWALWWQFWTSPHEWSSKTPKWRQGSFQFLDVLLGQYDHGVEILAAPRDVLIPMPEGAYRGTLKVERATWTRRRWPWWPLTRTRLYREIHVEDGIPYSGKGENSWDCGEDGLMSTSFECGSDEEAIGLFAARVMEYRKRRGDAPDYGRGVPMAATGAA
jgi:hypothetical protein